VAHSEESQLSLSPDGGMLLTSHAVIQPRANASLRLWGMKEGATPTGFDPGFEPGAARCTALDISGDGRLILSGMADGTALVWDVAGAHK
jgi:hypothetical protein